MPIRAQLTIHFQVFSLMEDANLHFCILKARTRVHFDRKEHFMRKESFDQVTNICINKRKLYTNSTVKDHGKYFG